MRPRVPFVSNPFGAISPNKVVETKRSRADKSKHGLQSKFTLSVYFSADAGENVKINFDEKIEKTEVKAEHLDFTRSDYLRPLVHCQHARVEPIYISGIACSISRKCYQNYRTACLQFYMERP